MVIFDTNVLISAALISGSTADLGVRRALAADASVIVTGDPDLLVLDPWRTVRILTLTDFLQEGSTG